MFSTIMYQTLNTATGTFDSLQNSDLWLGSHNANRKFFEELLSAAKVSTLGFCFVSGSMSPIYVGIFDMYHVHN